MKFENGKAYLAPHEEVSIGLGSNVIELNIDNIFTINDERRFAYTELDELRSSIETFTPSDSQEIRKMQNECCRLETVFNGILKGFIDYELGEELYADEVLSRANSHKQEE